MKLEGLNIGFAVTGSFCTFAKILPEMERLVEQKANVYPIFSTNASAMDTRFGKAQDWIDKIEAVCGNKSIMTIQAAEPIGPKNIIDILVIAPCTENPDKIQKDFLPAIGLTCFNQ